MDLRIQSIRYENIREFGELKLDLTKRGDTPHHVSIVQMPNGTGKTTTMELMRAILLGSDFGEDDIETYAPNDFDAERGIFEVNFEFSGELFTLRLEFDYQTKTHSYRYIRPQRTSGGETRGHSLPSELRNVMDENFVDLFVFNGELTEEFIKRGREEAEQALKIVNYLDRLEEQQELIADIVKERQEGSGASTEQGYKQTRTTLEKARRTLEDLQSEKDAIQRDIDKQESEISRLKEERDDILSDREDLLEKAQRVDQEIQNHLTSLENNTAKVLDKMRSPARLDENLNQDLERLLGNMDVLELPKSTSREFFRELSESPECICGRPINEEQKEAILTNSEKYLSEDDIASLNALKDQLRNIPDYEGFDELFEELDHDREQLQIVRQEEARINIDDPELQEKYEEIIGDLKTKNREKKELEEELDWLRTNDKNLQEEYGLDWQTNIPLCKRRVQQYKKKLRQASNTVNFGKKGDLLEKIFEDFIERTLDSLKERQIEETNEKLERILGLSKVQVEDIDNSLIIKDREGTSEGQSLSIAYAYLATLFEDSHLSVPFVIDSPAVSIDYEKREEVAKIIPDLFNQLVIFVISPERERFVSELNSDDIQYFTVHKTETPGQVEKSSSKGYFMKFQSEEELMEEA